MFNCIINSRNDIGPPDLPRQLAEEFSTKGVMGLYCDLMAPPPKQKSGAQDLDPITIPDTQETFHIIPPISPSAKWIRQIVNTARLGKKPPQVLRLFQTDDQLSELIEVSMAIVEAVFVLLIPPYLQQ